MKNLSVGTRLAILIIAGIAALAAASVLGIRGMHTVLDTVEELYGHNLTSTTAIGRIQLLMSDNRAQIMLALQHNPAGQYAKLHDHPLSLHLDNMAKNRD